MDEEEVQPIFQDKMLSVSYCAFLPVDMVLFCLRKSVVLSLLINGESFFIGVLMMNTDEKTQRALNLLRNKAEQLGTVPKRSDFDPEEVCFIKQKLGAWPRALEAAGLKEPPKVSAKQKSRRKRERRKRMLKQRKKEFSETILGGTDK